jgi:hypothetical protein
VLISLFSRRRYIPYKSALAFILICTFLFTLVSMDSFKSIAKASNLNVDYTTPGSYTWTVPDGVTSVQIECWGAQGEDNPADGVSGGKGGYDKGNLTVTPGTVLYIYVGGKGNGSTGGFNGGGSTDGIFGLAGGGASDVRQGGTDLSDRKIVAGGGGGSSLYVSDYYYGSYVQANGHDGGNGGGGDGEIGDATYWPGEAGFGGRGGTQNDGNALGQGQNGDSSQGYAAGGGGGYWGGYAGYQADIDNGGGGGGSGYTGGVTGGTMSNGIQSGNGRVLLNW